MEQISVFDSRFAPYGQVLEGYDFTDLIRVLEESTPCPKGGTVYVPSEPALEALPIFGEVRDRGFGGMPIQIGYCNGVNTRLTCLEYHRTSEIDIAATDMVFLVARQPEIENGVLTTDKVKAFFIPKGTAVELYATTLHYAPAAVGHGFRMGCALPRGTNLEAPAITQKGKEDRLLWGANKWVIASEGTDEAAQGAYVGIVGPEVDLAKD